MSSSTKEALGAALKKMMAIKPIDKITVKDLAEICNVNRQTFYYHFDDVYDLLEWVFEADAERRFRAEYLQLSEQDLYASFLQTKASKLHPQFCGHCLAEYED